MNRLNLIPEALLITAALSAALVACSSGHNSPPPSPSNGTPAASAATTLPAGCVPLNQPIYFTGSGILMDTSGLLYGGVVPNESTFGTLSLSATSGPMSGLLYVGERTASGAGDSVFQVSVPPVEATSFPINNLSVSGVLTIGPMDQQLILSQRPYQLGSMQPLSGQPAYQPYPTSTYPMPSAPTMQAQPSAAGVVCVSGMAIEGSLISVDINNFSGNVYLYLNGSQQAVTLTF